MSAYFVSKEDIDLIVSAIVEFKVSTRKEPDAIGKLLWLENVASLQARYPTKWQDICSAEDIENYSFEQFCDLKPVPVLKIVHCYEYQSCEHDEWESSEARKLCRALERTIVCNLPGYDDAPWGISNRKQLATVCNPNVVSLMSLIRS